MIAWMALCALLLVSPASAVTFSDTQTFTWSPGTTEIGAPTSEIDSQFYTDVGLSFGGSAFYDDTVPLLFETCLNPSDPADCYPVFGGTSGVDVSVDITIAGVSFDEADFGASAFVAVVSDGKFIFDPENPGGAGLPGLAFDLVALSSTQLSGSSPIAVGPGDRWQILGFSWYATFPADTLADPFGTSLSGIDVFNLGTVREMSFTISDTTTGLTGLAFARNPEPNAALLIGLGLTGLASIGRSGVRRNTGESPHGRHTG